MNLGLPNANKIDQEELSKLKDIVQSTSKALSEQEGKLKEIKDSKKSAMTDLHAQKRVSRRVQHSVHSWKLVMRRV